MEKLNNSYMGLKYKFKKWAIKYNRLINRKTKLLPDQEPLLRLWGTILRDKRSLALFCRIKDERMVYIMDGSDQIQIIMILKNPRDVDYELSLTDLRDGKTVNLDIELNKDIARVFIDKFDETTYRKILLLEKKRKNVMNQLLASYEVEKCY